MTPVAIVQQLHADEHVLATAHGAAFVAAARDRQLLIRAAGPAVLRRWVRAKGPRGMPLEALLRRDFGAFEDALADLADRGFVLRGGGGG